MGAEIMEGAAAKNTDDSIGRRHARWLVSSMAGVVYITKV